MGNVLSGNYTYGTTSADLGNLGKLEGVLIDGRVKRFLNVPYALPPTGEYRWKRPRALPEDYCYSEGETPFNATKFGRPCPQPNYTSLPVAETAGEGKKTFPFDEDCLRMNIWLPSGPAPESGFSTYVWLHGGWFQIGDPSIDPKMDPTELITTGGLNCIFISVGYRLGALGFLASKELLEESGDGSVGNYGLWDQRACLEWVHKNITKLGGNPQKVVLGGRSAGSYATHAHLVHDTLLAKPTEGGLFQRAIMISNAIPCLPKQLSEVQEQFEQLLTALSIPLTLSGPEKLARLRQVSAEVLMEKVMTIEQYTFRQVQDGVFFRNKTWLYDGKVAEEFKKRGMAVYMGECMDEETLYRSTFDFSDENSIRKACVQYYTTDEVRYVLQSPDPDPEINEYAKVFGDIASDCQVRAPSRSFARQLREAGVPLENVNRYIVGWVPQVVVDFSPKKFGVTHAMDRPIHNFSIMHGPTPKEEKLMKEWITDYANFVNWRPMNFGTTKWEEVKVLSSKHGGSILIEEDRKWGYLEKVSAIMEDRE
uniref:Carboxylesterase type B domain-containing protein n=1 Tax=Kwoniella bestiolae CBS 10118 TaxID=1296100 RepID=A0A1B9GBE0_9TREE|nr:hypothetical protein I302_03204 [Kwoniella bestiolae CBS 10118]OCF28345.1 hypothetical protein I302_03204 [Kwoniella bestiolae CBS 10118]